MENILDDTPTRCTHACQARYSVLHTHHGHGGAGGTRSDSSSDEMWESESEWLEMCVVQCVRVAMSVNEDLRMIAGGRAAEVLEFYKGMDVMNVEKVCVPYIYINIYIYIYIFVCIRGDERVMS